MQPTYKALFERYRDSVVLQKATQYAKWTLPQLTADASAARNGQAVVLERDYQEIGALLVNNLASKLAGLLFPSSRPFYKIKPSAAIKEAAKRRGVKDSDLFAGLARLEMASCQQLFTNASYEQLVLACKHLVVTGNVLLFRDSKQQKTLAYGVQSYVTRRDGRGNVMDIILREYTDYEALPPKVQDILRAKSPGSYQPENEGNNRVELYTRIKRDWATNGSGERTDKVIYKVSQEADSVPVGEPGTYPEHLCPWQAVTWSMITGENYGRGLVEDYAGGFAKLSDVSHAAALYGIAASKVVNLVTPGLGADVDELQAAETGEYVQGAEGAVSAHEGGDAAKMEQLRIEVEGVFGRLARAFMYKANTRDAERVTAYELKQDALEAENTLGGVYSSLSASCQIPLAHILLTETDPGTMEGVVTANLKLDILAGIPALGRQADVQNLAAASQDAAAIIPVLKQLSNRVDTEKVLDVIMAGQSVDTSTIYKSEEQIAEEEAADKLEAQGNAQIQASTTMQDQADQLNALTTG